MKYKNCVVIAEAGCNHMGDLGIAKEMILMAKICGANYVKFQKRDMKGHPEWKNKLYDNRNSFGLNYLEHRQHLEFSLEQHKELKTFCENKNIGYACSVWDIKSVKEIISLDPKFIKIPSALNNNYDLLNYIFTNYNKDVHISLGMATKKEKDILFNYIQDKKDKVVLYWTTSEYPANFTNLFLLEINNLLKLFKRVGYSGHNLGISVDICAYTLGVEWVERHFTLDRTMKGSDHSASLEPTGLQKLCRDLKAAEKALTYKYDDITEGEKINRDKLRST